MFVAPKCKMLYSYDVSCHIIILSAGGVIMDKSTKDVIIGAVISGAFVIIAACIEIHPSININDFMSVLKNEIDKMGIIIETIVSGNKNQSYVINLQGILGTWSGSYIGTSNNKEVEKEIQLYIGAGDNGGNVQGIAEIEGGEAGYYY